MKRVLYRVQSLIRLWKNEGTLTRSNVNGLINLLHQSKTPENEAQEAILWLDIHVLGAYPNTTPMKELEDK